MSDYSWLRQKSPENLERIQARAVGNQNAKKHGLYSRTPPAMTCNQCPNAKTCPYLPEGLLLVLTSSTRWQNGPSNSSGP